MAHLRPRPSPDHGADPPRKGPTIALASVLDGPRPGRDDPEGDRLWLDGQKAVAEVTLGHPAFDPRLTLGLHGAQLADWRARRYAYLAAALAHDPRVR